MQSTSSKSPAATATASRSTSSCKEKRSAPYPVLRAAKAVAEESWGTRHTMTDSTSSLTTQGTSIAPHHLPNTSRGSTSAHSKDTRNARRTAATQGMQSLRSQGVTIKCELEFKLMTHKNVLKTLEAVYVVGKKEADQISIAKSADPDAVTNLHKGIVISATKTVEARNKQFKMATEIKWQYDPRTQVELDEDVNLRDLTKSRPSRKNGRQGPAVRISQSPHV